MVFTSIAFAVFLPVVFVLYWFAASDVLGIFGKKPQLAAPGGALSSETFSSTNSIQTQNFLILVASYVFYGWWDWRFLSLILFSSTVDFLIGIKLGQTEDSKVRKHLMLASVFVNLGLLGFFKYFNFFIESFVAGFAAFGLNIDSPTLYIILPVGISFYTFQTMSYTLDVYRGTLKPTKDPLAFFAFVSFFPQLVAGPIERASNLLPQFYRERTLRYEDARDGLRQMLWGFFKKAVIADNCGIYANQIFEQSDTLSGSVLLLGAFYFSFQVYADFSGYSDIAIGTARLFGFKLMTNFRYPFFSTSVAELWTRWHISLNTWFADYVYKPLAMYFRNWDHFAIPLSIFITFSLSGLWHGAGWNFVGWGVFMSSAVIFETLTRKKRKKLRKKMGTRVWNSMGWGMTFAWFVLSMIYFRSATLTDAHIFFGNMLSRDLFALPHPLSLGKFGPWILLMIGVEWLQREQVHPLILDRFPRWVRWVVYYVILYLLSNYGVSNQSFIYFQF